MSRSPEYTQGKRAGIKWAITYLHERAKEMCDPQAAAVLNTAAFHMGVDAKRVNVSRAQLECESGTAYEACDEPFDEQWNAGL